MLNCNILYMLSVKKLFLSACFYAHNVYNRKCKEVTYIMPLTGKEMAKLAEKNGWVEIRQNGSHHHFKHEDFDYIVTIPIHGNKDLGRGLESKILKDLGLK